MFFAFCCTFYNLLIASQTPLVSYFYSATTLYFVSVSFTLLDLSVTPGCSKSLQWLSKEWKHFFLMKKHIFIQIAEKEHPVWMGDRNGVVSKRGLGPGQPDIYRRQYGKVGQTRNTLVSYLTIWVCLSLTVSFPETVTFSFDPTFLFCHYLAVFLCPFHSPPMVH